MGGSKDAVEELEQATSPIASARQHDGTQSARARYRHDATKHKEEECTWGRARGIDKDAAGDLRILWRRGVANTAAKQEELSDSSHGARAKGKGRWYAREESSSRRRWMWSAHSTGGGRARPAVGGCWSGEDGGGVEVRRERQQR